MCLENSVLCYTTGPRLKNLTRRLTCVDEHMSAQVIGATEGGIAVLTDMWLGAGRQATPLCIQHHGLQESAIAR